MRMKLRDRIAVRITGWTFRHIASRECKERFVRVLTTGDPEERVPVEEVVRPFSGPDRIREAIRRDRGGDPPARVQGFA